MGGVERFHALNGKISKDSVLTPLLVVSFLDDINIENQEFKATLKVKYLTPISNNFKDIYTKEIEESTVNFSR